MLARAVLRVHVGLGAAGLLALAALPLFTAALLLGHLLTAALPPPAAALVAVGRPLLAAVALLLRPVLSLLLAASLALSALPGEVLAFRFAELLRAAPA